MWRLFSLRLCRRKLLRSGPWTCVASISVTRSESTLPAPDLVGYSSRLAPPTVVSSRAPIAFWWHRAKRPSGPRQVTFGTPVKSLQISPRRLCTVARCWAREDAPSGSWKCGTRLVKVPAGAGRRCGPWACSSQRIGKRGGSVWSKRSFTRGRRVPTTTWQTLDGRARRQGKFRLCT